MNSPTFVVVNRADKFLTAKGWVEEYPDARIFKTFKQAKIYALHVRADTVVKDYGLSTEKRYSLDPPIMVSCPWCDGHGEVEATCDICGVDLTDKNIAEESEKRVRRK